MSSGGGTTTVQKNEIPEWVQEAGKENLARANYVSQLGYMPNYGMDVAAFSPMQQQAMQNTANTASALFGTPQMDAMAGMPTPQTSNLGFSGYSSGDLYDQAMAQLQQRAPAQYDAYRDMFIDPMTGEQNVAFTPVGSFASENAGAGTQGLVDYGSDSSYGGTGAEAVSFSQALQNLADAPAWLHALPVVGGAKALATKYVNDQARNTASPYAYTGRGFSDDGNTYTSSWGGTYDMGSSPYGGQRSQATQNMVSAGLNAVANDPYSSASGSTFGGYWD